MPSETQEEKTDVEQIKLTEQDSCKTKDEVLETTVENYADKYLIYGVNDAPPIHITIVCALQVRQVLLYSQIREQRPSKGSTKHDLY
jgi:hypothetical protein